jgi:hypothetical protein
MTPLSGRLSAWLLLLALGWASAGAQGAPVPAPQARQAWMRVEATVIPLRENTVRDGAILGYARKGDVLAVEKEGQNWVKLRANDTLSGWALKSLLSPSGPPVHWNLGRVKWSLAAAAGLGLLVFLILAVRLHLQRKAESLERSRQALADARRRLQNKIQLLFRSEPRIPSHLVMDEVDLPEFLGNIGYVANLEKDPERFLASCKAFKPNLILAAAEFQDHVEALVETDALLINTPVVYLLSDRAAGADNGRIRAHLDPNASDRELGEAISQCLKRSPEKIRYSVKPVALKGEIRGGTLVELLHFLATVKRSGRLVAASGGVRGEVLLHKGEIVRAACRDLTGARATEQVLNLAAGSFEFHEQDVGAVAESINTQKLLLDWAKTRDERDHHPRA